MPRREYLGCRGICSNEQHGLLAAGCLCGAWLVLHGHNAAAVAVSDHVGVADADADWVGVADADADWDGHANCVAHSHRHSVSGCIAVADWLSFALQHEYPGGHSISDRLGYRDAVKIANAVDLATAGSRSCCGGGDVAG